MNMIGMMYVVFGGAVGALSRYLLMNAVSRVTMADFPYATLLVNVLGSFILGAWIAVVAYTMPSKAKDLHMLLAIGVLGSFTTFSTFSLDVFFLVERGALVQASLYIALSVALSVIALMGGMWAIRSVFP